MRPKTALGIIIGLLVALQLIWLVQKQPLLQGKDAFPERKTAAHSPEEPQAPSLLNDYRQVWAAFYLLSSQSGPGLTSGQKRRLSEAFAAIRPQESLLSQKQQEMESLLTEEQANYIVLEAKNGFPELRNYPRPAVRMPQDPWVNAAEHFVSVRSKLSGGPDLPAGKPSPFSLDLSQLSKGILTLEKQPNLSLTPGQAGAMLDDFRLARGAQEKLNRLAFGWLEILDARQLEYIRGHLREIREITPQIKWSVLENRFTPR